jgi:hypothetical protein
MFGFPILAAMLQLTLFATMVRYDTPKWLAKKDNLESL